MYFKYETYTEFTELKPSQMHSVQSLVKLHFPPLDMIYHGATFMVVWDYVFGQILAMIFAAGVYYLGTGFWQRRGVPRQARRARRCGDGLPPGRRHDHGARRRSRCPIAWAINPDRQPYPWRRTNHPTDPSTRRASLRWSRRRW